MRRLALVNPNTDAGVTDAMLAIGREALPSGFVLEGRTAAFGARLIADEGALAVAARAVAEMAASLAAEDLAGVIVAAFGDPGIEALRTHVRVPVTGIAEAAMLEAAMLEEGAGGRRFAIVTTTPRLEAAIRARAAAYGVGDRLCAIRFTPGDPAALTGQPDRLRAACAAAIEDDGAEAVVIGDGPLATAARQLAGVFPVPIVEPIPAAVRLAAARAKTLTP